MPGAGDLQVNPSLVLPASELAWRFSRSSGPGGQGVNTADSRAELSFDVASSAVLSEHQRARLLDRLEGRLVGGVLTVAASEHRAQLRNRDAARVRLAALLQAGLAPAPRARRPTRPTRGSQRRRVETKKQRGLTKRLRRPPTD